MIRFRIGAAILLLLLALGLAAQAWTAAAAEPIVQALEDAQRAAQSGQWEGEEAFRQEAQRLWQTHWHLFAALADHQPMEDIDSLLAQLAAYAREQDTGAFSASAAELTRRVAAMADAQRFRWWNLL